MGPKRAFGTLFAAICAACAGGSSGTGPGAGAMDAGAIDAGPGDASSSGGDASSTDTGGEGGIAWPLPVDPRAFGAADTSKLTVAAFSQVNVYGNDPQVLDLAPDVVPRAWGQWDTSGLAPADYDFPYPAACKAGGTTFVGGLTASVIFVDEMSAGDFADEVGHDALDQPVPHSEIVSGAYRGALASPGFRQRLIDIAEIQIDGGVDGIFFDEVSSSYIGANYGGDEGFDDHDVADFGRFLCARHGAGGLGAFGLTAADHLDCTTADPGAAFDYRGYLARHGAQTAPLGAANPLRGEWGTTTPNRPNPAAGSFVESFPSLVYWQDIVLAVRTYARSKYGKEILITANGIFPFVDFQSVGLYDYNPDGPGPTGFDYAPVTGAAPDVHYDGTASFMSVFGALKASSDRIQDLVGGPHVPVLLFLDWPTPNIDRYYSMPVAERQDYIRVVLAEAYAWGDRFALPLATTTDSSTATALGMMDTFKALRAFYQTHAALFDRAADLTVTANASVPNVSSHMTALADGRTVVHLVNHNYAAGFVPQTGVTVTLPLAAAPSTVTLVSPDLPLDAPVPFTASAGQVTVQLGSLTSSAVLVLQ